MKDSTKYASTFQSRTNVHYYRVSPSPSRPVKVVHSTRLLPIATASSMLPAPSASGSIDGRLYPTPAAPEVLAAEVAGALEALPGATPLGDVAVDRRLDQELKRLERVWSSQLTNDAPQTEPRPLPTAPVAIEELTITAC